MTRLRVISLCLIFLTTLAACTTLNEETGQPSSPGFTSIPAGHPDLSVTEVPAPTTSGETQSTEELVPIIPGDPLSTVEMAPIFTADLLAALGDQLGVNPQDIRLLSFEAVEWPNSCLGVDRKGILCLDVITPGYLLIFETSNGIYEAHTNEDGSHFLFVQQTKLITTPP